MKDLNELKSLGINMRAISRLSGVDYWTLYRFTKSPKTRSLTDKEAAAVKKLLMGVKSGRSISRKKKA